MPTSQPARIVERHSDFWVVALTEASYARGYTIPEHVIEHFADTVAQLVEDDDTPCDRLAAVKREVAHG